MGSHAHLVLADGLKTMDLDRLYELKMIDLRLLLPWRAEAFMEIQIDSDREIVRERGEIIRSICNLVVYSDASDDRVT